MRAYLGLATLLMLGGASTAWAAPAAAPAYLLSVQFDDGDGLTGSPRLQVVAAEAASIAVGGAQGRFAMRVTATPQAAGTVLLSSTIDAVSHTGRVRHAAPALLVMIGQPATIVFGNEAPDEKPVRVSITVQPVVSR